MRLLTALLIFCWAASAGEYALFASGSRLHVDRHECQGARVRLYSGESELELGASAIVGFEPDGRPEPVPPAPAANLPQAPLTPGDLADSAADRYGLPRALVRTVMLAESANDSLAVSPKGAIGLMQLMPSTARELGADPRDPAQNVDAGARYLRDLLLKYDGRLWHALAAYNAGPGAVDKHKGVPPYAETVDYVVRIGKQLKLPPAGNAVAP